MVQCDDEERFLPECIGGFRPYDSESNQQEEDEGAGEDEEGDADEQVEEEIEYHSELNLWKDAIVYQKEQLDLASKNLYSLTGHVSGL